MEEDEDTIPGLCDMRYVTHYHCHWTGPFRSMISYITLQYDPSS